MEPVEEKELSGWAAIANAASGPLLQVRVRKVVFNSYSLENSIRFEFLESCLKNADLLNVLRFSKILGNFLYYFFSFQGL